MCIINNTHNTKRIIKRILIIMVKKREEDDNDDKKALALKTRDTMSLEMKNNEDDIYENDDE